jgi:hypothetical protein
VNFVDEGPASGIDLPLAINEFDPSLRSHVRKVLQNKLNEKQELLYDNKFAFLQLLMLHH